MVSHSIIRFTLPKYNFIFEPACNIDVIAESFQWVFRDDFPQESVQHTCLQNYVSNKCREEWCHSHLENSYFHCILLLLFTQSCPTLCNPMNCSTPGFPVLHYLPQFAQTHVHWVGDATQPSHPLLFPSPYASNLSQHQGKHHCFYTALYCDFKMACFNVIITFWLVVLLLS